MSNKPKLEARAADWRPMQLSSVRERLAEVQNLLRQAAAVGLAQDMERLETLAGLGRAGGKLGDSKRRRYR